MRSFLITVLLALSLSAIAQPRGRYGISTQQWARDTLRGFWDSTGVKAHASGADSTLYVTRTLLKDTSAALRAAISAGGLAWSDTLAKLVTVSDTVPIHSQIILKCNNTDTVLFLHGSDTARFLHGSDTTLLSAHMAAETTLVHNWVVGQAYLTSETGDISSVGVTAPITGGGTSGAVTMGWDSAAPLSYTKYLTTLETGHLLGYVFVAKTFTNVGTSWVDVYVTAFDAEDMMTIDFSNVDSVRAVFMVDYVGSGNDSTRWVNAADNTQLLLAAKFAGDCDAVNTGWVKLSPAFANATVTIEQQAMSATAANDPIYKGYALYAK